MTGKDAIVERLKALFYVDFEDNYKKSKLTSHQSHLGCHVSPEAGCLYGSSSIRQLVC